MAAAARIHIIERGHDPRRYALLAFGGAGPIHAAGVARILGQQRVIYPQAPGVLSAVGFLAAPAVFEFAQSRPQLLHAVDWDSTNAMLAELEERARAQLLQAGVAAERIEIERTADARFAGQLQEISFPLPDGPLGPDQVEAIVSRFSGVYIGLYGHLHEEVPIELLTWRVVARAQLAEVRIQQLPIAPDTAPPAAGTVRPVYWPEANGFVPTPVFARSGLQPGMVLAGPAIVEERESTLLVPPGAVGTVDGYLTLAVDRGAALADTGAGRVLESTGVPA
jgi:N-methylhydantoinase A/oxoprolinase/acetone carboxylase beta subunit